MILCGLLYVVTASPQSYALNTDGKSQKMLKYSRTSSSYSHWQNFKFVNEDTFTFTVLAKIDSTK